MKGVRLIGACIVFQTDGPANLPVKQPLEI